MERKKALFKLKKSTSGREIEDLKRENIELKEKLQELGEIEEALRESEQGYLDIFENVSDGIAYTTTAGKVVSCNQQVSDIVGLPLEDFLGHNIISLATRFLTKENAEEIMPHLKLIISGHSIPPFRIKINNKIVEICARINHKSKRLTATVRDITERIKSQDALQKSEERLQRAELASRSGNWELHLDTGVIIGSAGARQLYGVVEEEMSYATIKEVPLPEFRPLLDQALKDLIEKDIPYNVEFRARNIVSGEVFDIHSLAIYDKTNHIVFGALQDITQRKKAEYLVREKGKNLAKLFEITLELLETVDRKSLLAKVVQGVPDLPAMETGALYLLNGGDLFLEATNPPLPEDFPDDFRKAHLKDHIHIRQVLEEGHPIVIPDTSKGVFTPAEEMIIKGRNLGSVYSLPIMVSKQVAGILIFGTVGRPHYFSDDEIDVCRTLSNIASLALENSILFENLKMAKEKAEESDMLKTAFLHNISHEIRTPLNAIIGFSGFLDQPDLSNEERQSYIDVIFQSNSQLLSIINDILNISLIEAGQVTIKESDTSLYQILHSAYDHFRADASRKNIDFRLKFDTEDNRSWIISDEMKISHILENILNNAFKFTSSGYVELGATIKGNVCEIYVQDTGIGIDIREQKKIFGRFYQVDKSLSKLFSGMGLGLAIADAFVTLLGGSISLESSPGRGSKFSFKIPFRESSKNIISRTDGISLAEGILKKDYTILIAEDEESNFALLNAILKPMGFNILRANNGREAVSLAMEHSDIAMILMDIKMPELGGLEATSEILSRRPELTIIAQTAYVHPADIEKATEAGCKDYLPKPFNKNQLLEIIEKHLVVR